jgi:hypothetical protein
MKTLFKTIATVNSCQTIKQLKTAKNMVYNYSMLRPDDCAIKLLDELVYDNFKKIREAKRNEKICSIGID